MTIESLLSRPVSTLSSGATCAEAARRMRRQNIGSVIIEEDGAPIGVVTDRDLALRVVAEELDPGTVTVGSIMTRFPAFVTVERDLHAALDVMREMRVRRLPAVNAKGRVIGVLALDDVLIELAEQFGRVKDLLELERAQMDAGEEIAE